MCKKWAAEDLAWVSGGYPSKGDPFREIALWVTQAPGLKKQTET